jgi:hypothetical protein
MNVRCLSTVVSAATPLVSCRDAETQSRSHLADHRVLHPVWIGARTRANSFLRVSASLRESNKFSTHSALEGNNRCS